jgi:catechol 2,3-dioxygenase-like lactoylglutathione lyase family enzyme
MLCWMSFLQLMTIVVEDYDPAIAFFVHVLGFELVEDSPSLTKDGRPKRWVIVRPPSAQTGILLARADGDDQTAVLGKLLAGRVGFFLRVDDYGVTIERL